MLMLPINKSLAFNQTTCAAIVCFCLTVQSGCTSAISTAALREALRESVTYSSDSSAMQKNRTTQNEDAAKRSLEATTTTEDDVGGSCDTSDSDQGTGSSEVHQQNLTAALDAAVERLSQVGGLNEATQAALISTLEGTQADDWPAVIDAFASSLQSTQSTASTVATLTSLLEKPVAADAPAVSPTFVEDAVVPIPVIKIAVDDQPVATNVAEKPPATLEKQIAGVKTSSVPGEEKPVDENKQSDCEEKDPQRPALIVQNPCFVSRVKAWGVLDRFSTDCFTPGQELIVYFELENLSSNDSVDGHTTTIDTVLRLIGPDDKLAHEWRFDPIAETCHSHRHDYFARYLVQIPAAASQGAYRLEIAVTDAVAERTVQTQLPLEVCSEE